MRELSFMTDSDTGPFSKAKAKWDIRIALCKCPSAFLLLLSSRRLRRTCCFAQREMKSEVICGFPVCEFMRAMEERFHALRPRKAPFRILFKASCPS